jgi:ABC transporter with metal-binding/Fe-S-binding domain ATP-binding protein
VKTFALISGGKDSFLSALTAMEQGFGVDTGITVIPETDSMMYHVPNAKWASLTCDLLGIHWISTDEANFHNTVKKMASEGYRAMVAGAIASNYQKSRLERICTELGLCLYTPLWLLNQETVLHELLLRGITAQIISVSAEGFNSSDLGRVLNQEYITDLKTRSKRHHFNIAGEGGEYESFVTSFGKTEIRITLKKNVWKGSGGFTEIEKAELIRQA